MNEDVGLKKKKFLWIILIVIILALIAGGAYYLGTKRENNKSSDKSDTKTTSPESKTSGDTIDPSTLTFKDYASEDGIIKAKYPQTWNKSDIGDISTVAPKQLIDKYEIQMPLLVTYGNTEKFAQFTISKYKLDKNKTAEENINALIKEVESLGFKISGVEKKELNKSVYIVNSIYQKDNLTLKVQEKFFFLLADDKLICYIASFQSYEKDWQEFIKLSEYILENVSIKGVDSTSTNTTNNSSASNTSSDAEYLSEVYLATLPKNKVSSEIPLTKTSEFNLLENQFCITGNALKSIPEASYIIYKKGTKTEVGKKGPMSLGAGTFEGCDILNLSPGDYHLELSVNSQIISLLDFQVIK